MLRSEETMHGSKNMIKQVLEFIMRCAKRRSLEVIYTLMASSRLCYAVQMSGTLRLPHVYRSDVSQCTGSVRASKVQKYITVRLLPIKLFERMSDSHKGSRILQLASHEVCAATLGELIALTASC